MLRFSDDSNIICKNTLSIFFNTRLEQYLNQHKPKNIHITGVLTDISVLFAAYELRNMGYNTYVHKNGVQALNKEKQEYFIEYIRDILGAEIIE